MGSGLPPAKDSATEGDASKPLVVYGFTPLGGTASSASPFVSKLETYLRMAGIDYEARVGMSGAPKGKVPFIKQGDVTLGDSTFICEYLKNTYKGKLQTKEPDTAETKAVAAACRIICEDNLASGMSYYRWGHPKGFSATKERMSSIVPWFMMWLIPRMIRGKIMKNLYAQGLSRHSEKDVIFLLTSSVEALSGFLGDKRYMTGDVPCAADASVFGMLDNYLNDGLDLEPARIVKRFPNLVRYVTDIRRTYYPEDNPSQFSPAYKAGDATKRD
ncbi:unnamed protein product [Ostreobium quekettii]|uniref:Glutathione S-transferase n=1 Tax=Ostreobium quekettii TaxID=121088 RepID=A0A8S1J8I7_9CHLO|nr:unnamed protein product [Ostreobium quekettii]|eukprot:evm.model.scf_482.3 EVM.evm.TU.scf_482.3   scf_482:30244-33719(-)